MSPWAFCAGLDDSPRNRKGCPSLLCIAKITNIHQQLPKQGKYAEALPVAQEALHVAEATFGAQNPNTAAAIEQLGEVYQAQGKYAEAEPLFKSALDIREKAFGAESPAVAQSLNSLGELYRVEGKSTDAEASLERSLAIREKALGTMHSRIEHYSEVRPIGDCRRRRA
jgi:tetratricopeptide (TPR) repeat protein